MQGGAAQPLRPCLTVSLPHAPPSRRDEHSHVAEALLHELLVQRLRQSSGGDSNTASGGRAAGSGPEVRQPGGSGTAGTSGEATLAPTLQAGGARHHPAHQPQPGSSNGSGGPSGGTLVGSAEGAPAAAVALQPRQEIEPAEQPRHRRPSMPAAAPAHAAQRRPQYVAAGPAAGQAAEQRPHPRPVAAPRLPLPLQQLQEAALSGGSGNNTPHSARSVESAWSDSGGWAKSSRGVVRKGDGGRWGACCASPQRQVRCASCALH